ncbi:MAG: TetR/AcrR family transcriptional regulator [Acidimicrobiales bacterium]
MSVRDRLVNAAEVLFAERGVDDVSLREINAAAGASNASAIQYHFGDRAGLVRAVLAKHHPAVEARRHALLDQYEAAGRDDLRELAGAFVRSLAAELDDPDGGPGYLQVMADLANRPRPVVDPATTDDPRNSTARWRALVEPRLSPDAVRLHRRFVAVQFTLTELARRARSAPHTDNRLFTSHLVDLVAAVLAAPVSDETRRLDSQRPARRRRPPNRG